MSPASEASDVRHPLGPIVLRRRLAHPVRSRLIAGGILVAFLAPIIVAAALQPDPAGAGTHRQLGMAPCTLLVVTGVPCPTCGMTTAFSHTVRAQWRDAFNAQPMGFLLAVALLFAAGATVVTLIDGCGWSVNWYRVSLTRAVIAIVLLFAAAWAYKILIVTAATSR